MPAEHRNENPIRLLHLSDVHFAAGKAWDADPVLQALAFFIRKEAEAGLVPDLVAITGDLAFSGKKEEYELALDWFRRQLWPALPGLPSDRLLLVPGNHDVDRSKVSGGAKSIQKGLLDGGCQKAVAEVLQNEDDRNLLLKRHVAYLDFLREWYGEPQTLPWWQRNIEVRGTRLHFAGLDSALLAHGDEDRNHLLIGRYQLHQTVLAPEADGADWRLALLHHPWDYLAEWEMHEARETIHLQCDLLLRGHLHAPQTERIVPPDPARACLELAAGCIYESSRYPNAFQWIELYPEPRRVKVLFRAWLRGAWAIDRNQPGCPEGEAEYLLKAANPGQSRPNSGPATPVGNHYQATVTGSGTIAQGSGAMAVGAGGVAIRGNNSGNINTGAQINTNGGAYVGGNVNTGSGTFIGRDFTAGQTKKPKGD
jgi:calcineurin-like phosphoesterase family protein